MPARLMLSCRRFAVATQGKEILSSVGVTAGAGQTAVKTQFTAGKPHQACCAGCFAAVLKHVRRKGCGLFFNKALALQAIVRRFGNRQGVTAGY